MRRIVALALLALTLGAAAAHAQGDTRKLAVMVMTGRQGQGALGSIGAGDGSVASIYSKDLYNNLFNILRDAGVPYDVIPFVDSTRFGSNVAPGVDDSTWFRQQGYMALVWIQGPVGTGSGATKEPYTFFTAGATRGTQAVSPMSGRWSIPAYVVMATNLESNTGFSFANGVKSDISGTAENNNRVIFTNGDTLEYGFGTSKLVLQPNEASSVTVIARTDSANGVSLAAWRYATGSGAGCYYWRGGFGSTPAALLLALGHLFENVGYRPPRKIPAMIVVDRPFPESPHVTKLDTLLRTAKANGWVLLGADNSEEYTTSFRFAGGDTVANPSSGSWLAAQAPGVQSIYRNLDAMVFVPQSHTNRIGNYTSGESWDQVGFSDTTLLRQRWNLLESRIADNYKLPLARGYYRHAIMPDAGISIMQAAAMSNGGYLTLRSNTISDSGRAKRVVFGAVRGSFPVLPTGSSRPMWATWFTGLNGGGGDSAYANMEYAFSSNTYTGRMGELVSDLATVIARGGQMYVHGGPTLSGPDLTGVNYSRRMTYFLNRVSSFVTVRPFVNTKQPAPAGRSPRS